MKQLGHPSCMSGFLRPPKFLVFALLLIFSAGWNEILYAQDSSLTIDGRILDSSNNQPLAGATIWLKETAVSRITDSDGKYSIPVDNENSILVFRIPGYAEKEERVGNRRNIVVGLAESSTVMEDIVVVGYGSQTRESVVAAITSVEPKNLKLPTAFVGTAIAGQLSGFTTIQRSGEPASHAEFWIRGLSSTKNNAPLVLVDGIERSMDHVEVDDIESFSILKDAAATAVYGVRGANGVVLITTKGGEIGAPKISLHTFAGMVAPTRIPKFVNSYQFADYYNEAFGYENNGSAYYDDYTMEMYRTKADPDLYPDVNWIDEVFKKHAWQQKLGLNISGGGSIARYYISASYYHEGSIFKNDEMRNYDSSITFDKFNFRSKVDVNLTKTTVVSINLSNIYETKVTPGGADYWMHAFEFAPNVMPARYSDGTLAGRTGLPDHRKYNPYVNLTQRGYRNNFWNNALSEAVITQNLKFITKGLKASAKFSWDVNNSHQLNYINDPATYVADTQRDPDGNLQFTEVNKGTESMTYSRSAGGGRTTYLEASLSYGRDFGKHRVSGLFLYNQKSYRNLMADAGSPLQSIPFRNQGIAGRATYSFDLRYFAEFNFGYNGSENFSPGNRFGFFPSAAVGWMISNEKFFKPLTPVVNMLKFRASYGVVGNDNIGGNRRFIYYGNFIRESNVFQFGQFQANGIRMGNIPNDEVSWETVNKLDVGIELSLFRMLKIEADYYDEHRTGIFLERDDISPTSGIITNPWVNCGEVRNRGFDTQLEMNKRFGNDFILQVRGNISFNNNVLIQDAAPAWDLAYRDRKGRTVGQQYGYVAEGLYSSEEEIANSPTFHSEVRVGDIKYRDINGDGLIDNKDQMAIGYSWMPKVSYGFGASMSWKNFDLSFLFQGVSKVTAMFNGNSFLPFTSTNMSISGFYLDVYENCWTLDNPDSGAKYPRPSIGLESNNTQTSTYWMRDVSYMRLKNATIGYTFPKRIANKMHMSSLRLYLSGVNLFTIDKVKLFDPEISNSQGAGYPPTRTISLGLNVNF